MICDICSLVCIYIAEACTDAHELARVSIYHYKYSIERTPKTLNIKS
jgi:hypothetical protein